VRAALPSRLVATKRCEKVLLGSGAANAATEVTAGVESLRLYGTHVISTALLRLVDFKASGSRTQPLALTVSPTAPSTGARSARAR
jgi:hypothetical protein